MAWGMRAVALWCAVVVMWSHANGYTVDCNHEYTDCDTELSKLANEEEEVPSSTAAVVSVTETDIPSTTSTTTVPPTRSTPNINHATNEKTTEMAITKDVLDVTEASAKPKPRLLNLNVDELQNFANALHNKTYEKGQKKSLVDLSDVNLDGEDEDEPPKLIDNDEKHKPLPDKFYTNLQAPFNPLLGVDKGSEELETCRENGITYKIGEHLERGCEEICVCSSGGSFDCSPRCKHPYIRRGRRLNDPLCFESPVDECCSIIACATGNGEMKPAMLEVCRYGNDTYPVGHTWDVGCEQRCTCEKSSIVTCKPRCNRLPLSDKCINVQDPNDDCCEVQVCDVSQDAHEEPMDNVTSSTSTTTTEPTPKDFLQYMTDPESPTRPLVLPEPIGSIKVLHNNSVEVNLIHVNSTEDPIHLLLSDDGGQTYKNIELKYSNLILSLDGGKDYILKTRETGTKFNFTITSSDSEANEVPVKQSSNSTRIGCYEDGQFYAVGEEFHIGCTELCECTGHDSRECAPLECPNHVGLELVSKGCVVWAASPPAQPPNCCPRSARCLSDGTCHYKGVAIPNWSEVPSSLTGCGEHCFCENGELDCQDICGTPALPPQTLRCPPMHHPALVNKSDNCCKQWDCVPHAGEPKESFQKYSMRIFGEEPMVNYVTPTTPIVPNFINYIPIPPTVTDSTNFYKHIDQMKPKHPKIVKPVDSPNGAIPSKINIHHSLKLRPESDHKAENITVFSPEDISSPLQTAYDDDFMKKSENWENAQHNLPEHPSNNQNIIQTNAILPSDLHTKQPLNILSDTNVHDSWQRAQTNPPLQSNSFIPNDMFVKQMHENVKKIPLSQVDTFHHYLPMYEKKSNQIPFKLSEKLGNAPKVQKMFQPFPYINYSFSYLTPKPPESYPYKQENHDLVHDSHRKQVTVLRHKDLNTARQNEKPNSASWGSPYSKNLVLTKTPNPYDTVLLRAKPAKTPESVLASKIHGDTYSPLELEHLLGQMEIESEVNRNLGRSAEKSHGTTAAGQIAGFPQNVPRPPPSFLPTVPPGPRYPQDGIPGYDQNNIHQPGNPLDPNVPGLPPGFPIQGNSDDTKKLTVISIQSDSPTSVKMLFGLPSILVGLRGSVDLRFTDSPDEDVSHWMSQVFAPADEVLTTPRLEFRLTGLKPSTSYKIRGKLYLHNLPVEPESDVYSIRTQDLPTLPPVEEKRREIDSKLTVVDVNDTTAHVSWRHFTEEELQFIDGIQVRYRPRGTPIYSMTELLHHSRSTADLQELRPGSRYEASLVLIPPPRATTELLDPAIVEFSTAPHIDPYNWSVILEVRSVGSEAAELTWRGVPSPAERWVRVYRAAHACGESRKEHDSFRLAARDSPPAITLTGLEIDAKCRVWLELFLTNGKIKTSNVLEIHTKSHDSSEPIDNVVEASSVAGGGGEARGDYYGALVVVGVVAALAALAAALLLLALMRRHRPRSVPITPVPTAPRDSSLPPYDNPAYKLELQQETMDL